MINFFLWFLFWINLVSMPAYGLDCIKACFGKKVQRRQQLAPEYQLAPLVVEDDDTTLVQINARVIRIKDMSDPSELKEWKSSIPKWIARLKKDESYEKFIEDQNIFFLRGLGSCPEAPYFTTQTPLPKVLITLITDYLRQCQWQKGKNYECGFKDGCLKNICIFDARNKKHILMSPSSRDFFEDVASIRFVSEDDLRQTHFFLVNGVTKEDTGLVATIAKRGELLLVPVVD